MNHISRENGKHSFGAKKGSIVLEISKTYGLKDRKLLGASKDMQIVDHSATAQIEEILTHSQITCMVSLPLTHMGQRMLNRDAFAQLGPPCLCVLALTQLDDQSFIGQDTHTASFGTGGALCLQGALVTGLFRKVNHSPWHKRHVLRSRTLDRLALPVQDKGLLLKTLPLTNWPGFAIHFQFFGALANQMTTQIGSVNVQFLQRHLLPVQILADRFGPIGFGFIGRRDSHSSDQTSIQVVKHVAFISIHEQAATFASMTHLLIFDTDPSIFGYPFEQARFPLFIDLDILRFDLLDTDTYDGLLIFTAFVAIKCAWLGELPGSTSIFG
jgi:hypothetical protein